MAGVGNLPKRVAFESPTSAPDGGGGSVRGWNEEFSRRAKYTRLRGGEAVMAARLSGRQPTVIRVRFDSSTRTIKTSWRIRDVHTGEAFNIRALVRSEDRLWLDIDAESGVAI
jgi:head-tail adaptor